MRFIQTYINEHKEQQFLDHTKDCPICGLNYPTILSAVESGVATNKFGIVYLCSQVSINQPADNSSGVACTSK